MNPDIAQRMKSAKWVYEDDHHYFPESCVWSREGWCVVFCHGSSGHSVYLTTNIHDHNAGITGTDPFDTPEKAFEAFLKLPLLATTVSGLTGIR